MPDIGALDAPGAERVHARARSATLCIAFSSWPCSTSQAHPRGRQEGPDLARRRRRPALPARRPLHRDVGHYNAQTEPSTIKLDEERVRDWLDKGAQPTDTVRKLLQDARASTPDPASACASCSSTSLGRCVDEPDAVAVEEFEEDDGTIVLELVGRRRRLRQGHRPRRPHRAGAAHRRQGRRGQGQPPRARRHRRLTRYRRGRARRPRRTASTAASTSRARAPRCSP